MTTSSRTILFTALAAGLGLSACGNSEYNALVSQYDDIEDATRVFFVPTAITAAGLPTTGTGTYSGAMTVKATQTEDTIAEMIGAVDMTANFTPTGAAISGQATNFYTNERGGVFSGASTGKAVPGTLVLSNGQLDRGQSIPNPNALLDASFYVKADGTLAHPDGDLVVNGDVYGQVRGMGSEYLDGHLSGDISRGAKLYRMDGKLYAERSAP